VLKKKGKYKDDSQHNRKEVSKLPLSRYKTWQGLVSDAMVWYNKQGEKTESTILLDHITTSSQPSTELYTWRPMLFTELWTILGNIMQQQPYQQSLLYGSGPLTLISISFSTGCRHMGHLFDWNRRVFAHSLHKHWQERTNQIKN
jgi:hypothetical protein